MEADKYHKVQVTVPEEVLRTAGIRRAELEREVVQRVALSFFADGTLSFGQAARLAGLDYRAFADLVARRKAVYQLEIEDLEDDLRNLRELGLA
ncbi:MAG: UPF0175 family protein [Desulfotomaculales bacterium]